MHVLLRWRVPVTGASTTEGRLWEQLCDAQDVLIANNGDLQLLAPSYLRKDTKVALLIPSSWVEEISYSI